MNYLLFLSVLNIGVFFFKGGESSFYIRSLLFPFIIDRWSSIFLALLSLISGIVFVWSYYYIDGEEFYQRFIIIVIRFVASIVILIFLSSFYGAMVGWDGLGVTSFLLVIYYKNRKSLGSGIITALTNRLGDCFLLIILGLSFFSSQLFTACHFILLFLLLTSITKSAQIPFSSWLPSAIAAPTPVRALVHSSTLVTAGVYLLLRFNTLSYEWLLVLGSLTIFIAGLCACTEIDIKKIVALSTLSQLGVIIVSLSLSQKDFCFFHLITHAMFKALLFMSVGVGIHTIYGSQDFRSFSGSRSSLMWPITFVLISNLSLLGFPFMSGFYRKDLILESFYSRNSRGLIGLIFLIGVGLTTAYSIKIINLAIFKKEPVAPSSLSSGGFSWQLKFPIVVLGFSSVFAGFFISFYLSYDLTLSLVVVDKLIPLFFILGGISLGIFVTNLKLAFFRSMWNLRSLFQKTRHYSSFISTLQTHDNGWVEFSGGLGTSLVLSFTSLVLHPFIRISIIVIWILRF